MTQGEGSAQVDARGGLVVAAKLFDGTSFTQRHAVLRAIGTVSINPPSILSQATGVVVIDTAAPNEDDFIEGKVGDLILFFAPDTLDGGLVINGAAFTDIDEVTLSITNASGGTIDGVARDWAYMVFAV